MIYAVIIVIVIFFIITTIAYIIYSIWNYSANAPPLQPEHNVETGIDSATLRTWPTLTYAEARSQDSRAIDTSCCSICLVDYEEEDETALRLLPECGHLFHAACVDPWLRRRQTCPVCRSWVLNGSRQTTSAEVISFEVDQM